MSDIRDGEAVTLGEAMDSERITGAQFHAADGVADWRVLFTGAKAYFATGSFERGVAFVNAIADVAESAGHHPDIDVRYSAVVVRLFTHDANALTGADLSLAQRISQIASEFGIRSDPSRVQVVQIAIDAFDIPAVLPFWRSVLGYDQKGDEDLVDPRSSSPDIWFQQLDEPRRHRNRIHVDVSLPRDQAESRIAAALAAGGRLVSDAHAPRWWTLADVEGNEVDVAPWPDDLAPTTHPG